MDLTLLHPKIVHLPIALAVLMPLISGGALWAWRAGVLSRQVWWGVVLLQGLLVASAAAALQTGDVDAERVERVVAESLVEAHEEAGEAFLWGGAAVLFAAAAALAVRRERTAQLVSMVAAVGTLAVLGLGYRVGELGGALVYQHGAASAFVGAGGAPPSHRGAALPTHGDDD